MCLFSKRVIEASFLNESILVDVDYGGAMSFNDLMAQNITTCSKRVKYSRSVDTMSFRIVHLRLLIFSIFELDHCFHHFYMIIHYNDFSRTLQFPPP